MTIFGVYVFQSPDSTSNSSNTGSPLLLGGRMRNLRAGAAGGDADAAAGAGIGMLPLTGIRLPARRDYGAGSPMCSQKFIRKPQIAFFNSISR